MPEWLSFQPAASAVTGSRGGRGHSALRKASIVCLLGADTNFQLLAAMPPAAIRPFFTRAQGLPVSESTVNVLWSTKVTHVYTYMYVHVSVILYQKTSATSHNIFSQGEREGEGRGRRGGRGVDEKHLQLEKLCQLEACQSATYTCTVWDIEAASPSPRTNHQLNLAVVRQALKAAYCDVSNRVT